jgi:hypothetical protein
MNLQQTVSVNLCFVLQSQESSVRYPHEPGTIVKFWWLETMCRSLTPGIIVASDSNVDDRLHRVWVLWSDP